MAYTKLPPGGRGLDTELYRSEPTGYHGKPMALPLKSPLEFGVYSLGPSTVAKPPPPRIPRHPGPSPRFMDIEPRDRVVAKLPDLVFEKAGEKPAFDIELLDLENPLSGEGDGPSTMGAVLGLAILAGAIYFFTKV